MRPKRFAKVLLGQALVRGGLWKRRLRTWADRSSVIILTYHRVTEAWDETLDYSQPGMVVTGSTFERHYDLAFPILRRHRLPATIYLATDFIGTDRAFWHTELIYLFTHTDVSRSLRDELTFRAYPSPVRHELRRLARGGPYGAHDLDPLIETVKALCDEEVIEDLVQALTRTVGLRRPLCQDRRFFLDWDQVRAMAAAGLEIGSHGCSHRIMTRLPAEAAKEELVRSKAEIEHRVGGKVEHFAFPNDAASGALVTAAATAGYRTACLAEPVTRRGALGIRLLRRLGMHEEVCGDGRSFNEGLLRYWLFRAPDGVPA